jgi:hypothetical protein
VSLLCLSSHCILCNQGCQCLCFVCLLITQDTGWRQTKQRHWQPWLHKIQGEDKQNKDTILCNQGCQCYLFCLFSPCILCIQGCQCFLFCLSSPCILCIQGCQCLCFVCLHPVQNKGTGNLDYTRYRMKTNKTKTLATLITQDTGWRQTKQITLATLITQDTGWRQTKQRHWQPWLHKIQGEDKQNK